VTLFMKNNMRHVVVDAYSIACLIVPAAPRAIAPAKKYGSLWPGAFYPGKVNDRVQTTGSMVGRSLCATAMYVAE